MKAFLIVFHTSILLLVAGCANDTGKTSSSDQLLIAPSQLPVEKSVADKKHRQPASQDEVIDFSKQTLPGSAETKVTSRLEETGYVAMEQAVVAANRAASLPVMESALMSLAYHADADREQYLQFDENRVLLAREKPVSTFSIDVDTAAYSNIRRMLLREGRLPPVDAVKIEEMINYFSYGYAGPDNLDTPFSVNTEVSVSPWNEGRYLLQIGMKGYQPAVAERPRANLVFLIDVSGSMMDQDKLPLVKRSLRMLVDQMNEDDRIALVVYAGAAGMVLESTPVAERNKIHRAIEMLQAGGSTNGGAGLKLAYSIASENFIDKGINRVVIASDGDMNVGIVDHDALKRLIEAKRETGIALTTLGFGSGNYNYALMEQLADIGNGNAAYIDSILEARKVLVNEMQSTLLTIAKDVKIQVEFNPGIVSEYRLIGYENRMLNREDFRNDKVDAGEIGAGHTVTAIYEIALATEPDGLIPELRYGESPPVSNGEAHVSGELAYISLRYKQPDMNTSLEIGQPVMVSDIQESVASASRDHRFAAAVAGFGQILKGGLHTGDFTFEQVLELARSARGDDQSGYRSEFVRLVELAETLGQQG